MGPTAIFLSKLAGCQTLLLLLRSRRRSLILESAYAHSEPVLKMSK